MDRHYEWTDEQYALVEDLMPATGKAGGQWKDHRTTLNGVFWLLHTGAQWREVPERYGKWQTVYGRFNLFRRNGTIARMLERLQAQLNDQGRIDSELWCIDATSIRASRSAAGARRGEKGGG